MFEGQCECGKAQWTVSGPPLLRALCHCTICQEFNQAPFADVTAFRLRDLELAEPGAHEFNRLRPPPSVQRGRCASCGQATVEIFRQPLMPRLAIIPSARLEPLAELPQPRFHMFYNRRRSDVTDTLPHYSGYLSSQWAFARRLIPALLRTAD